MEEEYKTIVSKLQTIHCLKQISCRGINSSCTFNRTSCKNPVRDIKSINVVVQVT